MQSCIALSTAEAEYIALSQAAQEAIAIGLRQLYTDLQGEPSEPITDYYVLILYFIILLLLLCFTRRYKTK